MMIPDVDKFNFVPLDPENEIEILICDIFNSCENISDDEQERERFIRYEFPFIKYNLAMLHYYKNNAYIIQGPVWVYINYNYGIKYIEIEKIMRRVIDYNLNTKITACGNGTFWIDYETGEYINPDEWYEKVKGKRFDTEEKKLIPSEEWEKKYPDRIKLNKQWDDDFKKENPDFEEKEREKYKKWKKYYDMKKGGKII